MAASEEVKKDRIRGPKVGLVDIPGRGPESWKSQMGACLTMSQVMRRRVNTALSQDPSAGTQSLSSP